MDGGNETESYVIGAVIREIWAKFQKEYPSHLRPLDAFKAQRTEIAVVIIRLSLQRIQHVYVGGYVRVPPV
eukprot:scaffold8049_cov286-Pinguiococcus_pyrenoidosus.AAC.1